MTYTLISPDPVTGTDHAQHFATRADLVAHLAALTGQHPTPPEAASDPAPAPPGLPF